jgi:RecB family exonuclease
MHVLGEDSMFHRYWKNRAEQPEAPPPGESFFPVIPLALCRASDEALQSATCHPPALKGEKSTPTPPKIKHLAAMLQIEAERETFLETPSPDRQPSPVCGYLGSMHEQVKIWLKEKKEFSPSALEKLAENPYIFLLTQLFRIQDPRIPADTPDPRNRGGLIHFILCTIYSAIARDEAGLNLPRRWAEKADSTWRIQTKETAQSIPLANFQQTHQAEIFAFAECTAKKIMNEAIAREKMLGHPVIWSTEQEKILVQVLNQVQLDIETCEAETRFPAYFEYTFSHLDLQGIIEARGTVDRIDLIFNPDNELEKIRVLDYKGISAAKNRAEYIQDIHRMLDAQLPIYALAAQKLFFGETHTDFANARTEAGYLFYDRDFEMVKRKVKSSLVQMDEPLLFETFFKTLSENIQRIKTGNFPTDPLIASYTDYSAICRTTPIAPNELS